MHMQSARPDCGPPRCCGYPVVWMPVMLWPGSAEQMVVEEIDADATTPTRSALVGGRGESRLTVEYSVASGATSPSVTVTIVADGKTTTWTDTSIAAGYHVYDGLGAVHAGATVTLTVTNATARVRWCERICCC